MNCRKNTESKNEKVVKTKIAILMFLLNCAICNSKKLRFIIGQEAVGLLRSLGIMRPLSKILFSRFSFVLGVLTW